MASRVVAREGGVEGFRASRVQRGRHGRGRGRGKRSKDFYFLLLSPLLFLSFFFWCSSLWRGGVREGSWLLVTISQLRKKQGWPSRQLSKQPYRAAVGGRAGGWGRYRGQVH